MASSFCFVFSFWFWIWLITLQMFHFYTFWNLIWENFLKIRAWWTTWWWTDCENARLYILNVKYLMISGQNFDVLMQFYIWNLVSRVSERFYSNNCLARVILKVEYRRNLINYSLQVLSVNLPFQYLFVLKPY